MKPVSLAVLGSTGSIGRQTLEVVRSLPGRFNVIALAAGGDVTLLEEQAHLFRPRLICPRRPAQTGERLLGAQIRPIDSEHSAVWQCLWGESPDSVQRIVLTASGGPFRDTPREELARVTAEEALRHPHWQMGPKITVDSATPLTKGLEGIGARWLLGGPLERVG